MAVITIRINMGGGVNVLNESLQLGDTIYFCKNENYGGFDTVDNSIPALTNTGVVVLGELVGMNTGQFGEADSITVDIPSMTQAEIASLNVTQGDFIMFSKSNEANLSSLVGYYAEATFVNNSSHKAELFAVSTEASPSSK